MLTTMDNRLYLDQHVNKPVPSIRFLQNLEITYLSTTPYEFCKFWESMSFLWYQYQILCIFCLQIIIYRYVQILKFLCFKQIILLLFTIVGANVRLRYFLKVTIIRRLADIVKEIDIAVHTLSSYPEMNNSIKMEVGIEDCLHIEFEYNKSK